MTDDNKNCMDTILYKCMGTIEDNKKSRKSFSDSRLCISVFRLPLFLLPRERGNSVPWL